jgi:16S rRNA processing protein RimM
LNITDYFPAYKEVGYTKKSYGVNGHLRIFIEDDYLPSIESVQHVFFLLKGCLVPYFIQSYEDGLIKFESCEHPEDAKALVAKTIYMHEDQIIEVAPSTEVNSFAIVEGFELYDADTEELIGTVDEVVVYPQQEIAHIGNIMIPLNFENVKGIDMEGKSVFVEIPEGLLEINN